VRFAHYSRKKLSERLRTPPSRISGSTAHCGGSLNSLRSNNRSLFPATRLLPLMRCARSSTGAHCVFLLLRWGAGLLIPNL